MQLYFCTLLPLSKKTLTEKLKNVEIWTNFDITFDSPSQKKFPFHKYIPFQIQLGVIYNL